MVKYDKTKYKGVWKPNTLYDQTDLVFYNGSLWICRNEFSSTNVFDDINWVCPECGNELTSVVITSDKSEFSNNDTFEIQIQFSKMRTGFTIDSIDTSGKASLSNLVGSGASYTVDVRPLLTGDIPLFIPENTTIDGNTASEIVTVISVVPNVEQGFDLTLGTPGVHEYVNVLDKSIVYNSGSINMANGAQSAVARPHTDTTLRYFLYRIVNSSICMLGYGEDSVNDWVGDGPIAMGVLPWLKTIRLGGATVYAQSSVSFQNPSDGLGQEYVYYYTRGQRVWVGSITQANGNILWGGGDPEADLNPTYILPVEGFLKPMVTCHSASSVIEINTLSNFDHPPLFTSAISWGS